MTDREMLKQALIVLKWIRERGHESGVIPCPKDYGYYIEPMRYMARDMVEKIEKHITPNSGIDKRDNTSKT
jgi:hypothetical protein